ncbi:MAG: adenosylcobinamide amidohydrolase [Rhodobacterales bacterium]|nr:adenosylcobinamide amidohydrolase [Rhodobacterales bacterium]MDX5412739.1 adenosylcobinamide amidohydrolase [Rhodobacterales bacterium]
MIQPVFDHPWLTLDLGRDMRVISWAPHRPGIVTARHILWREVRNADLTEDFDVFPWLAQECRQRGMQEAVAMLTSRKIATFSVATSKVDGVEAQAVATVGLSNAERAAPVLDQPRQLHSSYGTINVAVILHHAINDTGLIEAQSIASAARTAAVLESGAMAPSGPATGTGTDCIAVAAPAGQDAFCGLHTAQGKAIAAAVYAAVREGADQWIAETGGMPYDLG